MTALDIRGHTVRRDGKVVATLTYSAGYTVVHADGAVVGRAFRVQKDPDRYWAWDACNPVALVLADNRLTDTVTYETAIETILWRHEQEQPRYTEVRFTDSDWTDGDTTLVTSNGHGVTNSEWRLADLRKLVEQAQARIEKLEEVRTDG